MTRERNALKAGLFIVLSFVAAVTAVLLIRGQSVGATQTQTVTFKLTDDLGGLSVGDDVRIGGVKVGAVRDITFADLQSPTARVLVRFTLPAEYVLHDDAHIGVQSALTGSPNLNITSLGSGKTLADGQALSGEPDAKAALLATLRQAAPKLNDTLASFKQTADAADQVMVQVRDVLGDSKTDIRGTLSNLNVATTTIREKLPPIMTRVDSIAEKVDSAMANAQAALQDIQKTAANARDLTATARSLIDDNRSRIDLMVKSLKTTSDNLKATSVEVRHSPWRLLYKPSADEMANLNLFDSVRQFAEGASSLSDAAGALRDALHDPNADKAQIKKLMDTLNDSFKNFHVTEEKLWTGVKE